MNRCAAICQIMILLFCSCSQQKTCNTIISGRIQDAGSRMQDAGARMRDAGSRMLLLQELGLDRSTNIDSVILNNEGKFLFRLSSDSTRMYLLRLTEHAPLVLEIVPGDSVKVVGAFSSFPEDVTISGSLNSSDLQGFFKVSAKNKVSFDSIQNILISRQDDPDFAKLTSTLDELARPIWERQKTLEKDYIDKHPASLTSLLVLNHALSLSPVLKFDEDSLYFLRLDSSLNHAFPGNKHAEFHHKRIIQARELKHPAGGS